MKMKNPPHPGAIIQEALDELNVSLREFAKAMDIAPSTASRLLTEKAALTPEMAVKLAIVIGSSASVWMKLQNAHSLAAAESAVDTSKLQALRDKLTRSSIQAEAANLYDGDEVFDKLIQNLS
ncbi:addiction module antidote protein, HigA family [Buttiauxella warmboldiae]|uniref:Addiction module antidote protein, HigA family n=1 Tax=Buttiauxella warmboldiae TaxID=82993 RepID=A0A3N5E1M0_9ENTR|nr:HigA family addiction module antitoxin [Buttiauxella warmboldiae]RPH28809.1 addiction module antidote protein, HigA family [Buttiauxella warmboldiae]